jgi:selenide,water dikinase
MIKLTEYAKCAGCASKMGPGELSTALSPLPKDTDPRLLVGRETFDDAAVYKLTDDIAIVQTVDFFAPIMDDPYRFGRVAATNALSDVYAMGGTPITAMNIVAFPEKSLPLEVLTEILRGGQDAVHAAGAKLVGGHTVIDEEPKYGLSVTGTVHPDKILSNTGARVGDILVLTKPLGTGILSTAAKRDCLIPEYLDTMYESMITLNDNASRWAVELGLKCATDITGFSLLGHASHIARASKVQLCIEYGTIFDIPTLPGVFDFWDTDEFVTGGGKRNRKWLEDKVDWDGIDERCIRLLTDPQTSGGLLVCVPPDKVKQYITNVPTSTIIGEVRAYEDCDHKLIKVI